MNTGTGGTLCGYCRRPVSSGTWIGGQFYHYECVHGPAPGWNQPPNLQPYTMGCICPPTSEQTCQKPILPAQVAPPTGNHTMSEWHWFTDPARRMAGYEGQRFVCYFWLSGLSHISLGLHLDWAMPNFEIHLPLGFIRIGVNGNV